MHLNFLVALDLSLIESSISARFYYDGSFAFWCSNCYCAGLSQGIGWLMIDDDEGV